jgi:hypothetical protein
MASIFPPSSRRAWLILAVASPALSVSIVVALAIAIGDPTLAIMGGASDGAEMVRTYYGPCLAICSFFLAFIGPTPSSVTVPLFAFSQVGGVVLALLLRNRPILDPSSWWLLLIVPLIIGTIVPWVALGGAVGLGVRLGARALAARTSR